VTGARAVPEPTRRIGLTVLVLLVLFLIEVGCVATRAVRLKVGPRPVDDLVVRLMTAGAGEIARVVPRIIPGRMGEAFVRPARGVVALVAIARADREVIARHIVHVAARQGHNRAQYNLGVMLEKGWGNPVNRDEALRWYRRAAVGGDERAAAKLREAGTRSRSSPAVSDLDPAELDRALRRAVEKGDEGLVRSLLQKSLNLEQRDAQGRTLLYEAVSRHDGGTAILLLRAGADLDLYDEHAETPLMLAARAGEMKLVAAITDAGAKLDIQDEAGRTALMWAARRGQHKIARVLLERGANPRLTHADGRNAASLAQGSGADDVVALLGKFGSTPVDGNRNAAAERRAWLARPPLRTRRARTAQPAKTGRMSGYTPLQFRAELRRVDQSAREGLQEARVRRRSSTSSCSTT